MSMSLEEFRTYLSSADGRAALGLALSDDEAQRVAADPASTQNWYSYWLASNPAAAQTAPPPAANDAPTAQYGDATAYPAAPTQSYPGASPAFDAATPADAQPTEALYATGVVSAGAAQYPGHDPQYGAATEYPNYGVTPDGTPQKKKRVGLWVTLSVLGALILIAAIVVVFAFATARTWTKVDVPEHPETFYTEEYETGRYDVAMDTVNPCHINQDWTDCTDLMVASYDGACAGVELTESATSLCARYQTAIDEMRALDGPGYYVATLGTYGTLSRTAEISTREVSNDDYRPAETHEAVCYLEFIGECE